MHSCPHCASTQTVKRAGIRHIAGTTTIHGAGEGATPSAATIRGANGSGTDISGANLTIQAGNGTGTATSGAILFQTAAASGTVAGTTTTDSLATRMSIGASGNVGIGTASPGQSVEVVSASSTFQMRLGIGGGTYSYDIGRNASDGLFHFHGNQSGYTGYVFDGINGERMRITSAGNVGIGTTAPGQMLSVAGVIESTTGGVKFPDGTTQTTAAGAGVSGTSDMTANVTPPYGLGYADLTGLSATLSTGTYLIIANMMTTIFCDANDCGTGSYYLRVYNATDSVVLPNGSYNFTNTQTGTYASQWSYATVVTISGTKLIKLQGSGSALGQSITFTAYGSKFTYVKIN